MKSKFLILLLLFSPLNLLAQYNGNDFSVCVSGVYTTSASIFLNPNSSDFELRNQSFDIEDIFNPGMELSYRVSEPLILSLNVEYIKKTKTAPNLNAFLSGTIVTLDVEDGFFMIPFELTAYYVLPVSTQRFKFLMGGGAAYYYGEFIRKVGDAEVTNLEHDNAFGIHVSVTTDYVVTDYLFIRFQMKFRDPEFTVKSRYNKEEVEYQDHLITLPQEPFETKVNIDGVTFLLGAAFQF